MKPKFQDYLTIAVALIAIFSSGYGVGYLLGEHRTAQQLRVTPAVVKDDAAPWEQRTLQRLEERLALTESQQKEIAAEIQAAAESLRQVRAKAVLESQLSILDLQKRMERHLDENQRNLIQEDRAVLERKIEAAAPVQE